MPGFPEQVLNMYMKALLISPTLLTLLETDHSNLFLNEEAGGGGGGVWWSWGKTQKNPAREKC